MSFPTIYIYYYYKKQLLQKYNFPLKGEAISPRLRTKLFIHLKVKSGDGKIVPNAQHTIIVHWFWNMMILSLMAIPF